MTRYFLWFENVFVFYGDRTVVYTQGQVKSISLKNPESWIPCLGKVRVFESELTEAEAKKLIVRLRMS